MANKMKNCKACGQEIAKSAKTCPHCGAKQKGSMGKILLGVLVALVLIGVMGSIGSKKSGTENGSTSGSNSGASTSITQTESSTNNETEQIEYTPITVAELEEALEANAMNASDTYKGNYYAVTGALSNIDSDGKYIGIEDPDAEFTFFTIQCYIKTDEVKDAIKQISKGDVITVYGQITDVGEIMGYSMNIDRIEN